MILTIKQFSVKYEIPIATCYQHAKKRILPSKKIGSTYLIDSNCLKEYQANLDKLDKEKEKRLGGTPRKFLLKTGK